jgi:hypothetical protein
MANESHDDPRESRRARETLDIDAGNGTGRDEIRCTGGLGVYTDSSAGYALAETDEKSLHAMVLKWIPYVVFNSKPVLTVDQCIANIKQAAAGVKR